MTRRHNHYEAAFEAVLREYEVPYVAVDEAKRSRMAGRSLKNLDFIVSPPNAAERWLVDVKGRRFGSSSKQAGRRHQAWKNWATRDDIESMAHWQTLFGVPFRPLLVFAYEIVDDVAPLPAEQLIPFRKRLYAMVAIRFDHYVSGARVISPKWGTCAMPADRFRELARPLECFLNGADAAAVSPIHSPDIIAPSRSAN